MPFTKFSGYLWINLLTLKMELGNKARYKEAVQYISVAILYEMFMAITTSSNGNMFRVTCSLWGESTGDRWIPLTTASDAEPSLFLWSAPEQSFEQTIETPVIWVAIALIMTSLRCITICKGNVVQCGIKLFNSISKTRENVIWVLTYEIINACTASIHTSDQCKINGECW